jgi:UDP-2,3-diacylglucosamine pyrophosphatase LpxH
MKYIVSDFHLGSLVSNTSSIIRFLERVKQESGQGLVEEFIINGDLFENLNVRLMDSEWTILSLLRDISLQLPLGSCTWVLGNHDYPKPQSVGNLIGFKTTLEYTFQFLNKKVLCIHGDLFDDFIKNRRFTTWLGDVIYKTAQYFDRQHRLAKFLKRSSKNFLRAIDKVRNDALEYARRVKADYVMCGHTHHAEKYGTYFNSGCWTERQCHYVVVQENRIELKEFV